MSHYPAIPPAVERLPAESPVVPDFAFPSRGFSTLDSMRCWLIQQLFGLLIYQKTPIEETRLSNRYLQTSKLAKV